MDVTDLRGHTVDTTDFVDALHVEIKKTRSSHTGYLIFFNKANMFCHIKINMKVEWSIFPSEVL